MQCDCSCMWPSTILLQNTFGKLSCMKGTTICANTSFTCKLAFTLLLKKTRRVLLCRVIPPHTCMDPPWRPSVLTFPLPLEFCPVDDSPSSAGPDVEWWTWKWTWLSWPREVFYAPCLVDALFQARYCRYTAAKRCCNVLFGLTRHEHPKCAVSFIFWEPWHDRTETYSTLTKLFLYNSYLPMTWRKEKVENLHLSCSTWFMCIFTNSLYVSILYLLCRNNWLICKQNRSTGVILNFEVSAMFNSRVIHIWNVCVFKCTEHITNTLNLHVKQHLQWVRNIYEYKYMSP